jgi:hypothetical protein
MFDHKAFRKRAEDTKIKVAVDEIKEMLNGNEFFSICGFDTLKSLGCIAHSAELSSLHSLHCVHYKDMDKDTMNGLKYLLREVLESSSVWSQVVSNVDNMDRLRLRSISYG